MPLNLELKVKVDKMDLAQQLYFLYLLVVTMRINQGVGNSNRLKVRRGAFQ